METGGEKQELTQKTTEIILTMQDFVNILGIFLLFLEGAIQKNESFSHTERVHKLNKENTEKANGFLIQEPNNKGKGLECYYQYRGSSVQNREEDTVDGNSQWIKDKEEREESKSLEGGKRLDGQDASAEERQEEEDGEAEEEEEEKDAATVSQNEDERHGDGDPSQSQGQDGLPQRSGLKLHTSLFLKTHTVKIHVIQTSIKVGGKYMNNFYLMNDEVNSLHYIQIKMFLTDWVQNDLLHVGHLLRKRFRHKRKAVGYEAVLYLCNPPHHDYIPAVLPCEGSKVSIGSVMG